MNIPIWLLWVLGIAVGFVVLVLALLGIIFLVWAFFYARAWDRTWGW